MPPRNATWSDSSQLVRSHVRKKERGEGKGRKKIREGRHAAGDTCCFVRKNPRQPAHQALVNNGAPVYLNAPDRSRMPVGEFFPRPAILLFLSLSLPLFLSLSFAFTYRTLTRRAAKSVRARTDLPVQQKRATHPFPNCWSPPFAPGDVKFQAFRAAMQEKSGKRMDEERREGDGSRTQWD